LTVYGVVLTAYPQYHEYYKQYFGKDPKGFVPTVHIPVPPAEFREPRREDIAAAPVPIQTWDPRFHVWNRCVPTGLLDSVPAAAAVASATVTVADCLPECPPLFRAVAQMAESRKNEVLPGCIREYFDVHVAFDTNTKARSPRGVDGYKLSPDGKQFEVHSPMCVRPRA
jgi:hypothetical protein